MNASRRAKPASSEISSVESALAMLDLFEQMQSVRVTDVSTALSVSTSSAHRMLSTFQARGFVHQERPHGPYRVGPNLARLSARLATRMDIRTATSPLLAELAAELNETVCVAVLLGTHVEFVAAAEPSGRPFLTVPDGMILATHATAAGKALIADFQRADVERLYPTENLPRFTKNTLASRESLFRDLQQTRERGYAIHSQENNVNVTAYACAIRDLAGGARAAFVAVGPTQRFRQYSTSRIVAALRSAASSAIGFHTAAK